MLYRRVVRPALFRVGGGDAERAHHATVATLATVGKSGPVVRGMSALLARNLTVRTVFGVRFPGIVGVAAGLDKNGVAAATWSGLGFGFVELGTVTALAQPGNDTPRLFRLKGSLAIVNRMGFNNSGAQALADTLARSRKPDVPVGISLGKSKLVPLAEAVPDYLAGLRAVRAHADYLAVNVSSPNTPGLRALQDRGPLDELLAALVAEAGRLPVLVKIAPDLTDDALAGVLQVCHDRKVAGIIATNTTLSRDGLAPTDVPLGAEAGGLSGAPLTVRAREVVRFVAGHTDLPVIGVGGILTPSDGLALLDAGASLLQVYTGLIYSGPGLVTGLNKAIARRALT